MLGDWENVFTTLKEKLHKSWSSQLAKVNPRFCSTKNLLLLPTPPPPSPHGQDDSPSQGNQSYVAVISLHTWVKRDGEAKLPHYSNDTAINFIPEQAHFLCICLLQSWNGWFQILSALCSDYSRHLRVEGGGSVYMLHNKYECCS